MKKLVLTAILSGTGMIVQAQSDEVVDAQSQARRAAAQASMAQRQAAEAQETVNALLEERIQEMDEQAAAKRRQAAAYQQLEEQKRIEQQQQEQEAASQRVFVALPIEKQLIELRQRDVMLRVTINSSPDPSKALSAAQQLQENSRIETELETKIRQAKGK